MSPKAKNILYTVFVTLFILSNVGVTCAADLTSCLAGVGKHCDPSCVGDSCEYTANCDTMMYLNKLCSCMYEVPSCGENLTSAELIDKIFGSGNITTSYEYGQFIKVAEHSLEPTNYLDNYGLLAATDASNEQNIAERVALLNKILDITKSFDAKVYKQMFSVGSSDSSNDDYLFNGYMYEYMDIEEAFWESRKLDGNCTASTLACAIAKFDAVNPEDTKTLYKFRDAINSSPYGLYQREGELEAVNFLKEQLAYTTQWKVLNAYETRIAEWRDYYQKAYMDALYIQDAYNAYRNKETSGLFDENEYELGNNYKPEYNPILEYRPDVFNLLSSYVDWESVKENAYLINLQINEDADYVFTLANRNSYDEFMSGWEDPTPFYATTEGQILIYGTIGAANFAGAALVLGPVITPSLFGISKAAAEIGTGIATAEEIKENSSKAVYVYDTGKLSDKLSKLVNDVFRTNRLKYNYDGSAGISPDFVESSVKYSEHSRDVYFQAADGVQHTMRISQTQMDRINEVIKYIEKAIPSSASSTVTHEAKARIFNATEAALYRSKDIMSNKSGYDSIVEFWTWNDSFIMDKAHEVSETLEGHIYYDLLEGVLNLLNDPSVIRTILP